LLNQLQALENQLIKQVRDILFRRAATCISSQFSDIAQETEFSACVRAIIIDSVSFVIAPVLGGKTSIGMHHRRSVCMRWKS